MAIAGTVLAVSAVQHLRTSTPDYREGLVSDERPLSLNPLVGAGDPPVRDLGTLLYRRLLRLDARARPVPDLAGSIAVSADGMSYTVHMAAGQEWSDGRPITAADVVATVRWLQSPAFGDPATASAWGDVHVEAAGETVTFDLAGPRASFPALLTQLPVLPLSHLSQGAITALRRHAVSPLPSSGPFTVVGTSTTVVHLFPNPHAHDRPRLNQLELDLFGSFAQAAAAFRAHAVDGVLALDPEERATLVHDGGIAHDLTTFRFVDLLFNEREPALADGAVRLALATTIDRAALVAGPLGGLGVAQVGAIPAGVAWAAGPASGAAPNPTGASAALEGDGWRAGPDGVRTRGGVRLRLPIAVADVAPLPQLAAAVSGQLSVIGVDAPVVTLSTVALRQTLLGGSGWVLAIADWDGGPDPDVSSFWRSTAAPPAGLNVSGAPADPFLDQALDRLATLSDPAARVAAATAVSSQLLDDLPAVFLDTPKVSFVVRPGIDVAVPPVGTTSDRFDDVATWHRA